MTQDLLAPEPTLLPPDPAAVGLQSGASVSDVVRQHPQSSLAWAALSDEALAAGDDLAGYAYARVGYHRGLDLLRRNGWKGHGPIPWSHEPNQGFLRCLANLSRAAGAIGEVDEEQRCAKFLHDASPEAGSVGTA